MTGAAEYQWQHEHRLRRDTGLSPCPADRYCLYCRKQRVTQRGELRGSR
jgi:hypothetical protein